MIGLLSAVLVAGSPSPTDVAAAAASRCDTAAYQAVVDRVEDQALAAMKAANEAVARAARIGDVGDAGDAEWRSYKALMAQADQLRWANASRLASCGAAIREGSVQPEPPAVAQPILGQSSPEFRPPRFHVSLTGGLADTESGLGAIPIFAEAGSYQITSTSPNAPIVFPGRTFMPATDTPSGQSVKLKTSAWEDQNTLSVGYARNGYHAPGWRFFASLSIDTGRIKESLGAPLVSGPANIDLTATPSISCVLLSVATGQCQLFSLAVHYTAKTFGLPTAANSTTTMQVNEDTIEQNYTRVGFEGGVSRAFRVSPVLGGVNLTPGVEVGGHWWSFQESQILSYGQVGGCCAGTVSYASRGAGPGFSRRGYAGAGRQVFASVAAAMGIDRRGRRRMGRAHRLQRPRLIGSPRSNPNDVQLRQPDRV